MGEQLTQSRRGFLRKVAGTTGVLAATAFGATGEAAADPPTNVTVSETGGGNIAYQIATTGHIQKGSDANAGDTVVNSGNQHYAEGSVHNTGQDTYQFDYQVSFIIVAGNGSVKFWFDNGLGFTGDARIEIVGDGGGVFNQNLCNLDTTGNITSPGDGSLESSDSAEYYQDAENSEGHSQTYNGGHDRFNSTGRLTYVGMNPAIADSDVDEGLSLRRDINATW